MYFRQIQLYKWITTRIAADCDVSYMTLFHCFGVVQMIWELLIAEAMHAGLGICCQEGFHGFLVTLQLVHVQSDVLHRLLYRPVRCWCRMLCKECLKV